MTLHVKQSVELCLPPGWGTTGLFTLWGCGIGVGLAGWLMDSRSAPVGGSFCAAARYFWIDEIWPKDAESLSSKRWFSRRQPLEILVRSCWSLEVSLPLEMSLLMRVVILDSRSASLATCASDLSHRSEQDFSKLLICNVFFAFFDAYDN